jgi:hypothetical protein
MAAYLIAFAKVKNANRIPEYSSAPGRHYERQGEALSPAARCGRSLAGSALIPA